MAILQGTGSAKVRPAPPRRALRQLAREVLRTRAVLHEGRRRDDLARRSRKHPPIILTPDQSAGFPLLAAHLAAHPAPNGGGWPPSLTRSSAALLLDLDALHAARGPLVLLTVNLDTLDELPLKSQELADLARELVAVYLQELARPGAPYVVAVQRGATGHTHAHLVLSLADLQPDHAAPVLAARAGPGGGCDLLDGQAHGVRLRNTPRDRSRVAGYLTRDPDGRFDDPTSPAYLQAHEDELSRKRRGDRSPRLGWPSGVLALRRAVSIKGLTLTPTPHPFTAPPQPTRNRPRPTPHPPRLRAEG